MARPKSTTPPKGKLTLSVTAQTRAELEFISQQTGISISEGLAAWATKEAKKLAKKAGVDVPDARQMELDV